MGELENMGNQIFDMLQHVDCHIDMLLDVERVKSRMSKLECIVYGNEFCNCIHK